MKNQHDILMYRKRAARYIGYSPTTLSTWVSTHQHDLQPVKIGAQTVRYKKSALDKFLREGLIC